MPLAKIWGATGDGGPGRGRGRLPLPRVLRKRGDSPVGWINDQRGSVLERSVDHPDGILRGERAPGLLVTTECVQEHVVAGREVPVSTLEELIGSRLQIGDFLVREKSSPFPWLRSL